MSGPPPGGPPPNAIVDRSLIPVKGGVEDWKEEYKQFLLVLKAQPGCNRTRWGPIMEDMNTLDLWTGWNDPESRDAFYSSEAYTKVMEVMKPILTGEIVHYSIKFKPAVKGGIDAPVVQVTTIKNCTGSEDDLRPTFEKGFALDGAKPGACGFSTGGEKTFVGVFGWESKEAADKADRSVYVPSNVGEAEVHHVNFNFPIKGYSVVNKN